MRIVIKYIYIMSVTKCHELKHKYKITQQYYITYSKICQIWRLFMKKAIEQNKIQLACYMSGDLSFRKTEDGYVLAIL